MPTHHENLGGLPRQTQTSSSPKPLTETFLACMLNTTLIKRLWKPLAVITAESAKAAETIKVAFSVYSAVKTRLPKSRALTQETHLVL